MHRFIPDRGMARPPPLSSPWQKAETIGCQACLDEKVIPARSGFCKGQVLRQKKHTGRLEIALFQPEEERMFRATVKIYVDNK
ncbi:MAG: hypothetical protein GY849_16760 [Deltaproteobacteria bacterium]|nr:hypothetical protein [Deltaproteobacteria bacterium]